MDTPKSFATLAGLKPALKAARTILALAGGMAPVGAALRTILAATGAVSSTTGAIPWLLSLTAETNSAPPCFANGDTDQVNQFFVFKLAHALYEVKKMRPPLLARCSVAWI